MKSVLSFLLLVVGRATSPPPHARTHGADAARGPWSEVPAVEMPTGDTSIPIALLRDVADVLLKLPGAKVRRHAVDNTNQRRFMGLLVVFAAVHGGCVFPWAAKKTIVEWPDPDSTPLVGAPMEAGAVLAAAAAVREMVKENKSPRLFRGCSSPEQGLDVAIFKDPKTGLYYVVLNERFDRCGGRTVRTLDAWYEYAVTAQGEVLGKAPPTHLAAPPLPLRNLLHPRKHRHLPFRLRQRMLLFGECRTATSPYMGRGTRWSTEYLEAMIAAWEKSGLTSEQFTATAAPGLPARTLRLHRQRREKEIHAELQRLRNENATLRSKLDASALVPNGCRVAAVSDPNGHGSGERHVANGTEAPLPPVTGPPATGAAQPGVETQGRAAGRTAGAHGGRVPEPGSTHEVARKHPVFSWD